MAVQTRDPYVTGLSKGRRDWPHVALEAKFLAVLKERHDDRALQLIPQGTRCIRRNEIHELMVTDEADAGPGRVIDRVANVCFAEFTAGGVLVEGDQVVVHGETIGEIAGFDETHMPNHQNIVIKSRERITGFERGYRLGDAISFIPVFTKG